MTKFLPLAIIAFASPIMNANSHNIIYPEAPRANVVDEYFGIKVADNYRPLENDTAASTLAWVKAENKVTFDYLSKIPYRDAIRKRIELFNNYPKYGIPSKENDGNYYFFNNDGLQNQAVLYRTADLDTEPEIFIDPNKLSADGTVALKGVYQSHDGKYTAYTISRNGSDWEEIYVMDTKSKQLLDDHIVWAKFTDAQWYGDGFFYSAYDRPEPGKEFSNANEYHKVFYHKLGTSQHDDVIAFENPNEPLHFHTAIVSDDQSLLMIIGSGQGIGNSLIIKDLTVDDAQWVTVELAQDSAIEPIDYIDGKLYIFTSKNTPKNKIAVVDINKPQPEYWVDLIPESDAVLVDAFFAGDNMILRYDKDASHHAYLVSKEGKMIREIALPTFGTITFTGSRKHSEVFYRFTSFCYAGDIYRYDMATGESTLYKSAAPKGFNPDDYTTEQVFYTSADGTRVPMFLTYKKGLKHDKKNPVYLYGYGGFNNSLNPGFSANRLFWLENGGIYAQANLRGGAEYGEEWHLAGTKLQKVNVFNDFIAAAEYLINEGWTSPELMTAEGGSNGGLLVGAAVNMRPDLFRVAIPRVGVMDMMRYHLFTIGWNWAPDYGTSADSPEMAKYLLDYSPIHNIRNDGSQYPAILITTADHDDRVVPAHSFKYAAVLQAANTGNRPKLIRIDSNAGHGGGKPIAKTIDEFTDIYSFIFYNLGITPKLD
ncbi:MAG: S9 family peptidase [Muribaculaceae bacterium]|nr:S9 family peptidase [Muribaculaceae bacterium]